MMLQILRIKEKIKLLSFNSPKLNLKNHIHTEASKQLESLYNCFGQLIQSDGVRTNTFSELKDLYIKLWETIKTGLKISKDQKPLNINSNPKETNSIAEIFYLSPKANFAQTLGISSIEKDIKNNFTSFKSNENPFGQNVVNIQKAKQYENTQSPIKKDETKVSFNQVLKSMKENIEFNQKGHIGNLDSGEKFLFQSPSDNGESLFMKDSFYPSTFKLDENKPNGKLKEFLLLTSFRKKRKCRYYSTFKSL